MSDYPMLNRTVGGQLVYRSDARACATHTKPQRRAISLEPAGKGGVYTLQQQEFVRSKQGYRDTNIGVALSVADAMQWVGDGRVTESVIPVREYYYQRMRRGLEWIALGISGRASAMRKLEASGQVTDACRIFEAGLPLPDWQLAQRVLEGEDVCGMFVLPERVASDTPSVFPEQPFVFLNEYWE